MGKDIFNQIAQNMENEDLQDPDLDLKKEIDLFILIQDLNPKDVIEENLNQDLDLNKKNINKKIVIKNSQKYLKVKVETEVKAKVKRKKVKIDLYSCNLFKYFKIFIECNFFIIIII